MMTQNCKQIAALSACTATSLVLAGCNSSGADAGGDGETFELDFGHVQTTEEPFHRGFETWAQQVSEATDDAVQITVHANSSLGSEEDILEQMTLGSSVGWQTDPARLGNYVPEWNVLYAPYFLDGEDDFEAIQDSQVIDGWIQQLEEEHGLKVLSYAFAQGERNVMSATPASTVEDLQNLEVRTAPADMWVATVNTFSTAVDLPYTEIYNSLETGAIDAAELSYAAADALNIDEVATHIVETEHMFQVNVCVVSAQWFDSLPEEYQTALEDELDTAGMEASRELLEANGAARDSLSEAGMELVPHSDLDTERLREAGEAAYEDMDLLDARDELYAEIR